MFAWYAQMPPSFFEGRSVPPVGSRAHGVNDWRRRVGYVDIWGGWRWMGAKQGRIERCGGSCGYATLGAINASSPDKETLFGTHPTGTGTERGWYTSHTPKGIGGSARFNNSVDAFYAATAVWYGDFGRTSDGTTIPADKTPNTNFFEAGTDTLVTSFVPLASPSRPNGDYKLASEDVGKEAIEHPVWEEKWNPALKGNASPADSDFYEAIGYTREWTFAEDNKTGMGPFSLDVGESVTFVFVAMGGFRLDGLIDAGKAADWVWDKGYDVSADLPVPAAPAMKVASSHRRNRKDLLDQYGQRRGTADRRVQDLASFAVPTPRLSRRRYSGCLTTTINSMSPDPFPTQSGSP